jgi:hypothetical protein
MDTLVGYVSFVFDAETISLKIVNQDRHNKFVYDSEEKVRLSNAVQDKYSSPWRSIADYGLIDQLLYKKIEVKVEKRDSFEIVGSANVIESSIV